MIEIVIEDYFLKFIGASLRRKIVLAIKANILLYPSMMTVLFCMSGKAFWAFFYSAL